jgi:hypothetical protein
LTALTIRKRNLHKPVVNIGLLADELDKLDNSSKITLNAKNATSHNANVCI